MMQTDSEKLKQHLYSLFLCCHSIMAGAVEALLKCHRFNLRLEIAGKNNPGAYLFVEMAQKLGVSFETVEVPSNLANRPWDWFGDRTAINQRAWIPEMKHREADFHVLFPFYLRYHLSALRQKDPGFPEFQVDNLYVVSLWMDCLDTAKTQMSARVLRDLLLWEKYRVLSVPRLADNLNNEMRAVHGKVTSLTDLSQLYLGFCRGGEGWAMVKGEEISNHPFNRFSYNRTHASAISVGSGVGGNVSFPVLVRNFVWDIGQITAITKNGWALNRFQLPGSTEDAKKTRDCLLLRLKGKSEDEIFTKLEFSDNTKYLDWQITRCIDTDSKRYRNSLEDWINACQYFEIEPNAEILDKPALPISQESVAKPATAPSDAAIPSTTPQFRHSPDFRSVMSADGRSFALTEKQAHVISLLYGFYEQGVPEVSQAHLIEEVYGYVSENRLKKLFDDNEAWDALIEKGRKKGLIRLKIGGSGEKKGS